MNRTPKNVRSCRANAPRALIAAAALTFGLASAPALAQFESMDSNILAVEKKSALEILKTTYDMGTVMQTDRPEFDFQFKNTGNATLEIIRVQSTCGCTVPELDKKIYAPGESGKIHVKYDPTGKLGTQHKQLRVFSNDPANPDIALTVQANVEPVIFMDPKVVNFVQIGKGEVKTLTIKVTGRAKNFAASLATVGRGDLFSIKVLPAIPVKLNDKEMQESTIEITLLGNSPVGRLADTLSIRTNDPIEPLVTCTISGFINGDLKAEPQVVAFGVVKPGDTFETEIKVINRGGKPFKISKVEVKQPNPIQLTLTATPVDPSNPTAYTIRATGIARAATERSNTQPIQGQLVITTDVDREETIEVPFYAQLRMVPTTK